jgi:hypothetical protein
VTLQYVRFQFSPERVFRPMVRRGAILPAPVLSRRDNSGSEAIQREQPWQDPEWQRLWLAVESRQWHSLALIPGGQGASLDFSLIVAVALSQTAMVHLGKPIQVADATQVPLNQMTAFSKEVQRCTSGGERLLVAFPPIGSNAITASIAQSTDAAVLCILSGKMSSGDAKRTVKVIGPTRFLGSAIFHPHTLPKR